MKLRIPATLISAFALALALTSCLQDGPSTETGNPNLGGSLTDAYGKPIPGVVKLYRLASATGRDDTSAAIPPVYLRTDTVKSDGKWSFDSLPNSYYAVEGIDAAGQRFGLLRDLLIEESNRKLVRALAVTPPGRIHGRATRGTNALPAGVIANEKIFVRLGGADRWAMTDTAGDYSIGNVPVGTFRMAFAAADGHYVTAYMDGIAVASGADVAVPRVDLEWSRFIAPPAVRGIAVAKDSAANIVRLSWRPVRLSGGAEVLYEVTRIASQFKDTITFRGGDTAILDVLGNLPRGSILDYTVRAINPLGEKGPADTLPPVISPGHDSVGPSAGVLEGVVHAKTAALASMQVKLYAIPAAPGSPDSLPLPAVLRDSAITDAAGKWRFQDLPAGRYTAIAQGKAGTTALAMGLEPRAAGLKLDSLEPLATGSVEGNASRDGKWVTQPHKGDENIHVSLAGTPFTFLTQYGSPPAGAAFSLKNVPPGTYRLVVYALPECNFLADTQTVVVAPGAVAKVPAVVKAAYNPNAPPPKLRSLAIASSTRTRVSLAWQADPGGYPMLKGYRVLRLSADLKALDSSAVIPDLHWDDDISKVAAGTKLKYVIRVVAANGREGAPGGNISGDPIELTVSGP